MFLALSFVSLIAMSDLKDLKSDRGDISGQISRDNGVTYSEIKTSINNIPTYCVTVSVDPLTTDGFWCIEFVQSEDPIVYANFTINLNTTVVGRTYKLGDPLIDIVYVSSQVDPSANILQMSFKITHLDDDTCEILISKLKYADRYGQTYILKNLKASNYLDGEHKYFFFSSQGLY